MPARILQYLFLSALLCTSPVSADMSGEEGVRAFVSEMAEEHGFQADQLLNMFSQVELADSVLEAISRPAESLPWYKYRAIFVRPDRIRLGARFLYENRELLQQVESEYGVPPEIITAIIGVETRYGTHKGAYRVIDSLATLAFFYPKRSAFFRSELEEFLLLTREQGLDPLEIKGSYAGAMGIPQFISSSYRNYAVDFNKDGRIDLWQSHADAIGSVANYFKRHGWKRDSQIIVPATVEGDGYKPALTDGLKPDINVGRLPSLGIYPEHPITGHPTVKLLELELPKGSEFWLGLDNFYVITRYNHSALYAMAVYQLSQAIVDEYANQVADNKH